VSIPQAKGREKLAQAKGCVFCTRRPGSIIPHNSSAEGAEDYEQRYFLERMFDVELKPRYKYLCNNDYNRVFPFRLPLAPSVLGFFVGDH
jgi:hypothetical protein